MGGGAVVVVHPDCKALEKKPGPRPGFLIGRSTPIISTFQPTRAAFKTTIARPSLTLRKLLGSPKRCVRTYVFLLSK